MYGIEASYEQVKHAAIMDRKNLSNYEAIPPERYKTGRPRRLSPKNCYVKAWQYVMWKDDLEGIRLVHGHYRPPLLDNHCGHAWVEFPEDIVFDGVLQRFYRKDDYYKYYEIIKHDEYTVDEMCRVGLECGGTYGPWR